MSRLRETVSTHEALSQILENQFTIMQELLAQSESLAHRQELRRRCQDTAQLMEYGS